MKLTLTACTAYLIATFICTALAYSQECGIDGMTCGGGETCEYDACGCCDSDACCDGSCCSHRWLACLGNLIKPSDHCFDDFVSPMSNFVFFEDPRTLTEARPIFFHHKLPSQVGSLGLPGGEVQLLAVQLRAALTDRLSLIAVKDGFIWADIAGGPLDALLNDGWADITAGLKYNLLRDTCRGSLLSTGFTYEIPIGSQRALQDIGDGEFHIFMSGGQRFLNGQAHYLGALGYRFPVDDNVQTSAFHWSNHFDVKLTDRVYAFTEFIWWHWTDSAATGLPLGVAGQDAFNLSSTNVTGNDLLTQSVGFKFKPSGNTELGLGYEFPLTGRRDIIDNRLQLDLILRY